MKTIFTFLFLTVCFSIFGQDGFRVIAKAEKQIDKGNLTKALRLLAKADSMDYGFCGNAWMDANEKITMNRVRIFVLKGEYLNAANELNRNHFYGIKGIDSLKIAYFTKHFGKAKVKTEIDSCLALIKVIDKREMKLILPVSFSEEPLTFSFETVVKLGALTFNDPTKDETITDLERFKAAVRKQAFYQLLL
jgi:hypothetical protein